AVSLAPTVAEVLAALATAFERVGCRWYLFGAQAAIVWGRPRLSADIDITVDVPIEGALELARVLESYGFGLRAGVTNHLIETTRVLPIVHRATGFPVDAVLAGPGLEQQFLDRVRRVTIGDREIPIASAEDVIVTKMLAGRAKDLEDVRGILQQGTDALDVEYIRETLLVLERALSRSDLLRELDAELARVRRESL
ncbi:MAG TPA: DUF6036 family nucleotidyltransferase, partial [Thermoanaerobaculia bacterium]